MDNRTDPPSFEMLPSAASLIEIKSLYEYVERRNVGEPGFRSSIVSMYKRNARWSNPFIRIAVRMAALVCRPRSGAIKYFFWGTKFKEIILGLPRHEVCVIGGPKQALFCLKHNIPLLVNMGLWSFLARDLDRNDFSGKDLENLTKRFGFQLKDKAAHNATLIVDNDSLPIQRAIIFSGRLAHLRSVCIQHGIFQSRSPSHTMDGWFADSFLAINNHQRHMLIDKGIAPDKIKVMGFHSSTYQIKRPISSAGQRSVCFLGQPWGKYGSERVTFYLEIVEKIIRTLHEEGINIAYKPHPWEKGANYFDRIGNIVDSGLHEAFEKYDVFISITSTALIEAQSAGRVAIQIIHDQFNADDLSVHGHIITINASQREDWARDLLIYLDAPACAPSQERLPALRLAEVLEARP